MARVVLIGNLAQVTGGVAEFDLSATSVQQLFRQLGELHPALAPLFADYYATRVPLTEQAVFVGVQGNRLHYTQLGQTFRHYVNAAGVNERKRVTPHTLRHVFASELLHAGANLRQIQELLGHKHLDSTQRYTRVNAHELRGAIKRLRWVG